MSADKGNMAIGGYEPVGNKRLAAIADTKRAELELELGRARAAAEAAIAQVHRIEGAIMLAKQLRQELSGGANDGNT
jgi:hypothetical protein